MILKSRTSKFESLVKDIGKSPPKNLPKPLEAKTNTFKFFNFSISKMKIKHNYSIITIPTGKTPNRKLLFSNNISKFVKLPISI